MTSIDHDRWRDDLAAYLLGALSEEEATELERHAEDCERCRTEMVWLTPAVSALPETAPRLRPAPELRQRLMAEVRAEADPASIVESDAEPGVAERASRWLRELGAGPMGRRPVVGFATALLVVVAVAGFAIGGGIGSDEGDATSTIVAGEAPGVTAKMVSEGDSGTLHLANVRQLPNDRVLEAWVQRNGEVEAVEALFVPDREGRASTELPDMDGVELVMVTTEPRGGSKAPTSDALVTIEVPQ
jgi:anti-sigma factor RsiW